LRDLDTVAEVAANETGDGLTAFPAGGQPIMGQIHELLSRHAWTPSELTLERGRLDQVFRDITGGARP